MIRQKKVRLLIILVFVLLISLIIYLDNRVWNDNSNFTLKKNLKATVYSDKKISDYIKNIYNEETSYLEQYINDIMKKFKNKNNKIVCAYLYNIKNTIYRSKIDDPIYRKSIFNKLDITYKEKEFKSVIDNCTDSVIII